MSGAKMFYPDTQVFIDFRRNKEIRAKLDSSVIAGQSFAVAAPVITEVSRGLIRSKGKTFSDDRKVFEWIRSNKCRVLELPRPFIASLLQKQARENGVKPEHYHQLISFIADSHDYDEFLERCKAPGSVWVDIEKADEIHESQLDKEVSALAKLAELGRLKAVAAALAKRFDTQTAVAEDMFSAAIEFLSSSGEKSLTGKNLRKNDPGLYVDFQLLLYLADPKLIFISREDFSCKIKNSPQRARIMSPLLL